MTKGSRRIVPIHPVNRLAIETALRAGIEDIGPLFAP
jgi:hypothetical protein